MSRYRREHPVALAAVAAAGDDQGGEPPADELVEHELVAAEDAFFGDIQTAKAVADVDVRAGV